MSLQIGFRNKRLLREWTTDRKCHLMQLKSGIGPPLRTAYGCRKWRQGRFCSISFCKNRCKASLWLIDVLAAVHDQLASEAQSSETSSLRSRQGSYEQVWKSFRSLETWVEAITDVPACCFWSSYGEKVVGRHNRSGLRRDVVRKALKSQVLTKRTCWILLIVAACFWLV